MKKRKIFHNVKRRKSIDGFEIAFILTFIFFISLILLYAYFNFFRFSYLPSPDEKGFFSFSPLNENLNCNENIDFSSDVLNCGGCGKNCFFPNAEISCINGECVFQRCFANYYNLDLFSSDGCECYNPENVNNYCLCKVSNNGIEACDGIDNDCDLSVDEDCSCSFKEKISCGVSNESNCRYGVQECLNGFWGSCVGNINPSPEICDGNDNNCDGVIDEGCSNVNVGNQIINGNVSETNNKINQKVSEIKNPEVINNIPEIPQADSYFKSPASSPIIQFFISYFYYIVGFLLIILIIFSVFIIRRIRKKILMSKLKEDFRKI